MKITISGYNHPDSLAKNLLFTFRRMGHTANYADDLRMMHYENRILFLLGSTLARFQKFEKYRSHQISNDVIAQKPDIFICVWAWVLPEAIKRIKDSGIKTVLIFPDHIANFDRQYLIQAPYDLICLKDPYAANLFKDKLKLPAIYLPEACNPMWHKPTVLTDAEKILYGCDITTASNMYPYRQKMLQTFDGYNMKLWGPSWPVWLNDSSIHKYWMGKSVYENEKAKAFGAAKIVLNTLHYAEIEGVNVRTFEAAGCGAFQIVDWKPGLKDLFNTESEIVSFTSQDDLREKVDYYLCHPDERRQIAEAGCLRAHRDHTYEVRINTILRELSL